MKVRYWNLKAFCWLVTCGDGRWWTCCPLIASGRSEVRGFERSSGPRIRSWFGAGGMAVEPGHVSDGRDSAGTGRLVSAVARILLSISRHMKSSLILMDTAAPFPPGSHGSQNGEPTYSAPTRPPRTPLGALMLVKAPRSTPSDLNQPTLIASGRRGRRFKSGHPDHKVLAGQRDSRAPLRGPSTGRERAAPRALGS
jgi:hypothetical protein